MKTKVIGMIGGIAPPSTIDYYQSIITGYQNKTRTLDYPSILINSINMTRMLELVGRKDFDALVEYLSHEIQKLKHGGADFAFLASNTPHIVFERLQMQSEIPLISIVESTIQYAQSLGFRTLGLFGTKFTMQGNFYQSGAEKKNIKLIIPDLQSQDYIHDKYMNELVMGIFQEETKRELIKIARKLKEENGIEGLILGGTELPLILKQSDFQDIKLLNTTAIHVEDIIKFSLT